MKRILIFLVLAILCTGCASTISVPEPQDPVYAFSEEEKALMTEVLWVEAGSNSRELQLACASVMVNQLESGWYGTTITEVLTRPNAYDGYRLRARAQGQNLDDCRQVVEEICLNGSQLPEYIWFFRAERPFGWEGVETYTVIDGVWFQFFPEPLREAGYH